MSKKTITYNYALQKPNLNSNFGKSRRKYISKTVVFLQIVEL